MTVAAGVRNQRITIQSPSSAPNTVGDNVQTWAEYSKAWAELTTNTGNEFERARQMHSELTHMLKCRWISGVTTDMRVLLGGRVLNILSAYDPYNRKDQLVILCNEQT